MHIFLDWDETLSSHDTLSHIAPDPAPSTSAPFTSYSEAYFKDLSEHSESYNIPKEEVKTIPEQFRFLDSLEVVEKKSVSRIEDGGLFVGWDLRLAQERAKDRVELRNGVKGELREFLARRGVRKGSGEVRSAVISVGWSRAFIRAALASDTEEDYPLDEVHANEVVLDPSTGKGNGKLSKSDEQAIRTGTDKSRVMRGLVQRWREERQSPSRSSDQLEYSVYVGDSTTDLPCLLAASVGIIMGKNASLQHSLQRLGLEDRLVEQEAWAAVKEKLADGAWRIKEVDTTAKDDYGEQLKREEIILIRVDDWRQGTEILEGLLELERNQGRK